MTQQPVKVRVATVARWYGEHPTLVSVAALGLIILAAHLVGPFMAEVVTGSPVDSESRFLANMVTAIVLALVLGPVHGYLVGRTGAPAQLRPSLMSGIPNLTPALMVSLSNQVRGMVGALLQQEHQDDLQRLLSSQKLEGGIRDGEFAIMALADAELQNPGDQCLPN